MRKVLMLATCVLLMVALAVSVSAAGSSVSLTPSSNTLGRGDTFTVVAKLTNSEAINLGTVALSYNTDVFELTGGTCHVSGANPAMVAVAQKAGTFFLQNARTVSGKIFTFNFKVKDNAPLGTYEITPTAAIGTSTGVKINATAAKVTVSCAHKYSAWADNGNGTHTRTCSTCQNVETKEHTWDNGKVTKEATCKEAGMKTTTCTTCKATQTAEIPQLTTHSYSKWTKSDDNNHKRICSVCQKEETATHNWDAGKITTKVSCKEDGVKTYTCADCKATRTEIIPKGEHDWNNGVVTTKATCKDEGVKTYTCSACKTTKTEAIPKTTTHTYKTWTKVDNATHKSACAVCQAEVTGNHSWDAGKVTKKANCIEDGVKTYTCSDCKATKTEKIAKTSTHTYKNGCDTDCDVCGVTRETKHNYKTSWSKDKSGHWHVCSECGDKKDFAAHKPGAAATEKKDQICTVCKYVIQKALGHTHKYGTEWTTDESGHWYACSGCDQKGSFEAHIFDNACDTDCSVCGYVRVAGHTYKTEWSSDGEKHWHECTGCGLKADEGEHIPGAAATETTGQTCTSCGYELAPALGTEPATDSEGSQNTDGGDNTAVIVVACVVGVAAIGGGAAFFIIKKKRA